MDILLAILAAIAIIIGLLGSILPILPGPPVAWVGLLLLHFSRYAQFSDSFLLITALVTAAIVGLDYILPAWITKRTGGSKWGTRGATAGMIIGLFAGPWGVVLGPLIGAFAGELIHDSNDLRKAVRSALGSLGGFLAGTGIKLIWCGLIAWWYIRALVQ